MFSTINGHLHCEQVNLTDLAKVHGTPLYVYSRTAIEAAYGEFADAAKHRAVLVCFGVKANSNIAVLQCLAKLGAGFDIVSIGELERALIAGAKPEKIVFSGVGKTVREMERALNVGIKCFNVESESELDRLQEVAKRLNKRAAISLRVNPDVDAGTHPYISTGLKENKFGIESERVVAAYQHASTLSHLDITGIDCHIGSQITEIAPFLAALEKILAFIDLLASKGIAIHHCDLGGGLGIDYNGETPPSRTALLQAIFARVDAWCSEGGKKRTIEIVFEMGRSMVGNAGVLLTQVEYLKRNGGKRYAVVDAAMNDLLRPTLYKAFHTISEVSVNPNDSPDIFDVVGPVCESGDWLGRDRNLRITQGSLLAIHSAGAYGMGMASNYNTRGRAAEILVCDNRATLVRRRETVEDQLAIEMLVPE